MEIARYIRILRKWAWFLLVCAFIGGGVSFIINTTRPPIYQTQAIVSIGQYIEAPNPDASEIRTGIELAQTYAQIAETYDVLQGTIDALNLNDMTPDNLRALVSTRILSGTSLLVINATYTEPVLTADIANTVADQLVEQSPTNLTPEQQAQIDFANTQITNLNAQLTDSRSQLVLLDSQLAASTDADEIDRLTVQRNAIVDQINQASSTVAQFTETITTLQQRTNSLQVIERARVPTTQSGANLIGSTLLGAAIGAIIALAIVLVIEYLDNTIRTTEDAAQTLALPVLGAIVRFGKKDGSYADHLVINQPSMSPVAEGYRTIRTNLLFSELGGQKSVFVITSSAPEEGKSVTAANLAVTMALAGLQVLLIDADLRRPKVHEVFGLDNNVGLTTLLFADPGNNPAEAASGESELPTNLQQCLQNTSVPRLRVITSGFIPSNPTEILGSALMQRWIEAFRSSSNIDVILFDTPPCLMVADSSVLAATVKADVVLVVDCGKTRRPAAIRAKETMTRLGVVVRGVVVNRINPRDETYEYGYKYGYYYSSPQRSGETSTRKLRFLGRRG